VDRCALFVDAGYVLGDGATAVHGAGHRDSVTWDFAGLLQFLTGVAADRTGLPVLRCYWYEATVDGRRGPEHDTLADLPGLMLRLGRMRPGKREGVETEIHRDLTTLARNRAIADVVLVSAEEDLAPVIADVQDLGVRVIIVHIPVAGNWTVSRALRRQCDDIVEINGTQLRPFAQLAAAEPARYSEPYANGAYGRQMSNGHSASLAGHGGQQIPPAGMSGAHPAPQAIYTAPVVAEYQSPSYPLPDGQLPMPQPPAAYPTAEAQPPAAAQPHQPEPARGPGSQGPSGPLPAQGDDGPVPPLPSRTSPPLYAAPPPSAFRDMPAQDLPGGSGPAQSGQGPSLPSLPGRRAAPQPGYEPAQPSAFADAAGSQFSPAPPEQFSVAPDQFSPAPPASGRRSQHDNGQANGTGTRSPLPSRTSQGSRGQPAAAPVPNGSYVPPQSSYSPALPGASGAGSAAPGTPLGDTVQAAHAEGFELGESVAREAPALWLEAVLARKPRMPSDLEARLLQGSALPIDSLLHDEVRHALRSGFWDALERSRR
jgi:NYN domain